MQRVVPLLCKDLEKKNALLGNDSLTRSRGNDIQYIASKRPMTTIGLLEAVFSVGSAPRLCNKDISRSAFSCQQFS
jgi:hypothetical protein